MNPFAFYQVQPVKNTTYIRQHYNLILQLFQWMQIDEAALLYGLDDTNNVCNEIDTFSMNLVAEKYKLTDLGLLPNDWQIKKIRDVCTLVNGREFKPFEWKQKGLPIIRIQNLNGSNEYNFYDGQYDKKLEIEKGQVIVCLVR